MTITTDTLAVPGAELYFEVRGSGPLIALVGAPADARSFEALADELAGEWTVLTADPRGVFRSSAADPDQDSTPEIRAADLAALIGHVDLGQAVVMGSSGGAVTSLALARHHRDSVRFVVAHEPPLTTLLPDRDEQFAKAETVVETYLAGDVVDAWRQFLANADIHMPDEVFQHAFGGERDAERASIERHFFTNELRPTTHFVPDIDALRGLVVVGIGEASTGQFCDRTSRALAAALGVEPVLFPGGHTGFSDETAPFAERLRAVLDR